MVATTPLGLALGLILDLALRAGFFLAAVFDLFFATVLRFFLVFAADFLRAFLAIGSPKLCRFAGIGLSGIVTLRQGLQQAQPGSSETKSRIHNPEVARPGRSVGGIDGVLHCGGVAIEPRFGATMQNSAGKKKEKCRNCEGKGLVKQGDKKVKCQRCGGTGYKQRSTESSPS
jgi:hypothetical protein